MNEIPSGAQGSVDVPVRILRNFFVFDPRTFKLVPLPYLWEGDGVCEAFGWAIAETETQEQRDRELPHEDGIWFRTSTILAYSLDVYKEYIGVFFA